MEKIDLQKIARDQLRRQMAEVDSISPGSYTVTADTVGVDNFKGILRLSEDGRYTLDLTGQPEGGGSFTTQGEGRWTYSREKRLLTLDGSTMVKSLTIPGIGATQPPSERTPTYFSISIEEHSGQRWKGACKDHHTGTSFALTLER